MAETTAEPTDANPEQVDSATEDMDLVENSETNGVKRAREEEEEEDEGNENDNVSKKQKGDKSVEEERLETLEGEEEKKEEEKEEEETGRVSLGPKSFGSSLEMFDYFFSFLHFWPTNLSINKYEHMVLLDLLKKGHSEPEKKIGDGIQAFQVRFHPTWKSRCFFLIQDDGSVDDFSFRKCVDNILPLPEEMKVKYDANKSLGGKGHGGRGGGGGRGGRGRGRRRGGKSRY